MDARAEAMAEQERRRSGRRKAPPCTMVIFGAAGDLTKRLLMPAIYNLSPRTGCCRTISR